VPPPSHRRGGRLRALGGGCGGVSLACFLKASSWQASPFSSLCTASKSPSLPPGTPWVYRPLPVPASPALRLAGKGAAPGLPTGDTASSIQRRAGGWLRTGVPWRDPRTSTLLRSTAAVSLYLSL